MSQNLFLHEVRVVADDGGIWDGVTVSIATLDVDTSAIVAGIAGVGSGAKTLADVYGAVAPPASFSGGTKTVASTATPEPLVAVPTPCTAVWLGARCNGSGVASNTKPVFLGDAASQSMPVLPANLAGVTVPIRDASLLYLAVGVNGEGLNFRILA